MDLERPAILLVSTVLLLGMSGAHEGEEPPTQSPGRPDVPFMLPTTNRALFEVEGEARFFSPTPGRDWTSGTYGCVRTDGFQFHEGLDIKWTQRDRKREPLDDVRATARGEVAYINSKPWSSQYGNYIVLKHRMEGLDVYSIYAHLSRIRDGLEVGGVVEAEAPLATMGRTANTRQSIHPDRAHVHFEIALLVTDRFHAWHRNKYKDGVNEHGNWNGLALAGLDPWALFRAQQRQGTNFSLVAFLRGQKELCRVWIGQDTFAWLERHPALLRPNPRAEREGIAGYEVALNYAGIPFEITPRAASEFQAAETFQLLSVDPEEQSANPCKKLLRWKEGRWQLTDRALEYFKLLTF